MQNLIILITLCASSWRLEKPRPPAYADTHTHIHRLRHIRSNHVSSLKIVASAPPPPFSRGLIERTVYSHSAVFCERVCVCNFFSIFCSQCHFPSSPRLRNERVRRVGDILQHPVASGGKVVKCSFRRGRELARLN